MLSTAFDGIDQLAYFLNKTEQIQFIRQYIGLINRLSYIQLQQEQWNYYYHIGMTYNIWTVCISKHLTEKNSICYTYGRSKMFIEQHRKKLQEQLQHAQHTKELFEKEILLKTAPYIDCTREIKLLSSIIDTFVSQHQHKLRNEFEYHRQMLIFDANDHRLVQEFFKLKPNKSMITSTRRIWQATAKQTMLDEQITVIEHRLTSKQVLPAFTLLDHMINHIEKHQIGHIEQFKHDIIHRSTITGRQMNENFMKALVNEKRKCSSHTTDKKDSVVFHAVKSRRLHMMKRVKYVINYKLTTSFNLNTT